MSREGDEAIRHASRALFDNIGQNSGGYIQFQDFQLALCKLGIPEDVIHEFFKAIDLDDDERISFEEFHHSISATEIFTAILYFYNSFNRRPDGTVDPIEAFKRIESYGITEQKTWDSEKARTLMNEALLNKNLTFPQFFTLMCESENYRPLLSMLQNKVMYAQGLSSIWYQTAFATQDDTIHQTILAPKPYASTGRAFKTLFSGACAGAVSKTCIAPLLNIKIQYQVSSEKFSYRGVYSRLIEIFRNEGIRGLWRGNMVSVVRTLPNAGIHFSMHTWTKNLLLKDGHQDLDLLPRFLCGVIAGTTATLTTYPLDLIRTRMALHRTPFKSVHDAFGKTYALGGFRGFYAGVLPTVLGMIPYAGTSWFTYETIKSWFRKYGEAQGRENRHQFLKMLESLVAGATAGLAGQAVAYPLEVIRRRMQIAQIVSPNIPHDTRIIETFCNIWQEGQFRSLFKGFSMNIMKGPITHGISFTCFELFQKLLL